MILFEGLRIRKKNSGIWLSPSFFFFLKKAFSCTLESAVFIEWNIDTYLGCLYIKAMVISNSWLFRAFYFHPDGCSGTSMHCHVLHAVGLLFVLCSKFLCFLFYSLMIVWSS